MKDLVKFSISDEYWGWVLLKTKSRSQILNINLGMCFKARASKPWTTYFCLFKAVSTENRPCFLSVSPTGLKLKTKHWKYIKKYLLPIPMLAICFSYFPSLLMRPCCLILTCKILVPNTSCKPRLLYFYPLLAFAATFYEEVISDKQTTELGYIYKRVILTFVHGVWKSQKKSHSTLWAERATFTFWVDKS